MAVTEVSHPHFSLPQVGKSRWKQIQPLLGISREKWRQLCLDGKAPKPTRLGERCTVWDNSEVHRWIADPLNYQAK